MEIYCGDKDVSNRRGTRFDFSRQSKEFEAAVRVRKMIFCNHTTSPLPASPMGLLPDVKAKFLSNAHFDQTVAQVRLFLSPERLTHHSLIMTLYL